MSDKQYRELLIACRKNGHNWGNRPGPGPYPITPFPAEGERQTCPVCGCSRYTEFGEIHYLGVTP